MSAVVDTRKRKTSDPADLYGNVLVEIISRKSLNNGEPLAHMRWIESLSLQLGEHVVQIGCGTGYYTAILAELVGTTGRVTAIELEKSLVRRMQDNLKQLPQVEVVHANGVEYPFAAADGIYVCAGATHPVRAWIDRLADRRPNPEEQAEAASERHFWDGILARALDALPPREQLIIHARYLAEAVPTREALGLELGISKERVRQLEARALGKLRRILGPIREGA